MAKKMWVPARTAIVCNGGDCFRQRCAFFFGGRCKRESHWGNEYSKNIIGVRGKLVSYALPPSGYSLYLRGRVKSVIPICLMSNGLQTPPLR